MSTKKQEEPWAMRADEVQRMLHIGKNTLYEWCERDVIPHKRVGRIILFPRRRIMEWLEKPNSAGGAS